MSIVSHLPIPPPVQQYLANRKPKKVFWGKFAKGKKSHITRTARAYGAGGVS